MFTTLSLLLMMGLGQEAPREASDFSMPSDTPLTREELIREVYWVIPQDYGKMRSPNWSGFDPYAMPGDHLPVFDVGLLMPPDGWGDFTPRDWGSAVNPNLICIELTDEESEFLKFMGALVPGASEGDPREAAIRHIVSKYFEDNKRASVATRTETPDADEDTARGEDSSAEVAGESARDGDAPRASEEAPSAQGTEDEQAEEENAQ